MWRVRAGPEFEDAKAGLAELASQVTELASQLSELAASLAASEVALASLQASVDCYVGHQTDDKDWDGETGWEEGDGLVGQWSDMNNNGAYTYWFQGPNSDAAAAYEDCF